MTPPVKHSVATPYRYTLSVTLLIIICIMLAMAGLYFQSYRDLENRLQKRLVIDKFVLQQSPEIVEVYKKNHPNKVVFIEVKKLPNALTLRKKESAIKLSKAIIRETSWDTKGINSEMLVTYVPHPQGAVIIGAKVSSDDFRHLLLKSLFYLIIIVTAIMLIYGFIISTHMARRIAKIDETARHIIDGNLQKRIPIPPHVVDEYSNLSVTLNNMLDRIGSLMQDIRQVNNNIAHDLKTPLNRLRSRIEIALLNPRSTEEYEEVMASSIHDIDELLNTFNALLLMGNLESNTRNYQLSVENGSQLLSQLGELYQAIAEEKEHQLDIEISEDIYLNINKTLFSQAISNLLDNAIKYTPEGGKLSLSLQRRGHMAQITITDNGPGIPCTEREKVFERFTRLDQSRCLPGTGLGMALVKAILSIHNATIQLNDNQPGLWVEVRLPTSLNH